MTANAVSQLSNQQASLQLKTLMIASLLKLRPELGGKVSLEAMDRVQLQSLQLDSLDTLEWAMEIEKAYEVEIEAVNFDPKLTLSGLAGELETLKQRQQAKL